MTDCEHIGFEATVEVNRLTKVDGGPVTGYSADVHIRCAMCHEAFIFIGVPGGLSPLEPRVSVDMTELRAPVRPASAPPEFGLDEFGFGIKLFGGEGKRVPAQPGVDVSDPNDHGIIHPFN